MKDNKENLNNELSNEAAETVAGGAGKDWSPEQKAAFNNFYGRSKHHATNLRRHYDPAGAVRLLREQLRRNMCRFTAEQIDKLEKDLGLS